MKLNSKIAAIVGATVIVVLGGGVGANAAGLIDSADIQNGSITGVDVDNGTIGTKDLINGGTNGVHSADITDGQVTLDDLAPQVEDTLAENLKQGGQLDANGRKLSDESHLTGTGFAAVPSAQAVLVTLTVTGTSTEAPSRVTFTVGGVPLTCVAAPAGSFEGTCSAVAVTTGGNVDVNVEGPAVEASLVAVQVG